MKKLWDRGCSPISREPEWLFFNNSHRKGLTEPNRKHFDFLLNKCFQSTWYFLKVTSTAPIVYTIYLLSKSPLKDRAWVNVNPIISGSSQILKLIGCNLRFQWLRETIQVLTCHTAKSHQVRLIGNKLKISTTYREETGSHLEKSNTITFLLENRRNTHTDLATKMLS